VVDDEKCEEIFAPSLQIFYGGPVRANVYICLRSVATRSPHHLAYLSYRSAYVINTAILAFQLMASESMFTEPWDLSDVTFAVEGRYIYANKTILSMWSPVLNAMFGGAFRESDAAVVKLPGKLYDDLLELICVLHPPNKPIDGKLSRVRDSENRGHSFRRQPKRLAN